MKYIVVYIIKLYQLTVGMYFRGNCKFYPTCSEYMKQAILKFGTIKGFSMGVSRLFKCHPYSKYFGIDEV